MPNPPSIEDVPEGGLEIMVLNLALRVKLLEKRNKLHEETIGKILKVITGDYE